MPSKRWRIWLAWGLVGFGLIGVGFALDAWLPAEPRFVLRGDQVPGHWFDQLSPDGKILTTRTLVRDANGILVCLSLKTWDTYSGQERGEFFRELARTDPIDFSIDYGVDSPDRRYYAFLQPQGLAVADLYSGREWPTVVKWRDPVQISESSPLFRLLQQSIAIGGLHEKVKLRIALRYIAERLYLYGKLSFVVDREAFAADLGADAPDPSEEEVCLSPVSEEMVADAALRLILAQVGKGMASFVVDRGIIKITTNKRRFATKVWLPVFSPRSTFVVQAEGRPEETKLNVVECCSGQLVASLSAHAGAHKVFGFSRDEELLYFFAADKEKPLFTIWNTRTRQVVWTFKEIGFIEDAKAYQFSPDGRLLLADTDQSGSGAVDLFDLRTGQKRRCFDNAGAREIIDDDEKKSKCRFSPDNRTLARITARELQVWDLAIGKMRWTRKIRRVGNWSGFSITEDSRVCAVTGLYGGFVTAWNLETGERLSHFDRPENNHDTALRFTPDHRYLVAPRMDRIDILVRETGEPCASLSLGPNHHVSDFFKKPSFTPDGRWMLSYWTFEEREPWFAKKWLGQWWPFQQEMACHVVAEVATGRVVLRLSDWTDHPRLSDDGRTLISFREVDTDTPYIYVWDVPGRPSRTLALGIPLALASCTVLIGWLFARRKRTPRQVAGDRLHHVTPIRCTHHHCFSWPTIPSLSCRLVVLRQESGRCALCGGCLPYAGPASSPPTAVPVGSYCFGSVPGR